MNEIEIQTQINELTADIKAIKNNNPNWASEAALIAAIAAKDNRILALNPPGKLPPNSHLVFISCS